MNTEPQEIPDQVPPDDKTSKERSELLESLSKIPGVPLVKESERWK